MNGEMGKEAIAKLGAKGVVFNMGAAGISKFSGLLFYILLLRFVTPAEGGVYFIYLAVANLIGLLGAFGIADALARFIPFYEGGGQRAKVKPLVYTALISFAFFSLIAGVAAFAARDWIAGSYSRELAGILVVTVLSGIAIALGTLLNSALLGLKRFGEAALYSAALPVAKIALTAGAFFYFAPVLDYALYATLATLLATDAAMAFSVVSRVGRLPGKFEPLGMKEIWEIASYGVAAALNQFSAYIMGWTDTLVLAYYAASKVVGAYNSVGNVARTLLQTVPSQIFAVLTSMLAHLHGAKSDIFGPLASNAARWSAYITLPVAALSMLFAKEAIEVLFPAYAGYYWLLYAFAPGLFIGVFSMPARSALSAVGRTDLLFKSTLIGIIPSIALNLLLVPVYGVVGAAIATITAYSLSELCAIIYAMRHAKFGFHPLLWKIIAPALAMCAAAALSYRYLFDFSAAGWVPEAIGAGLASVLALLVYFLILEKAGGINETDRKLIDRFVHTALSLANARR